MKIIIGKKSGFCFGVHKAVDTALANADNNTSTYGEIAHNEAVIEKLEKVGVFAVNNIDDIKTKKIIIRAHGISKEEYEKLEANNIEIIDATCPCVKKIHRIVEDYSGKGYKVIIIGHSAHPEVQGISGWVKDKNCVIVDENTDIGFLSAYEKLCVVAQTTFDIKKYANIIKKVEKHCSKTVEIFDTICYTTYERQKEAAKISSQCDTTLVLGSKKSSNTLKLFDVCKANCQRVYLIQNVQELKNLKLKLYGTLGIVAGASTPQELIMEVERYMSRQFEGVQNQEFIDGVEESLVSYKEGKRVKGTVILANDAGIKVNIGGKKDGFIPKDEVCIGEYNVADFSDGMELEVIITSKQDAESGCVLLSKKKVDLIKEGDKVVETIRNGEVFEFKADKETKGGLLGKLGTYTVFIPASQIRESFVKDLKSFVGKTLRLTAIEIDDNKHKIVASQRKVLEQERTERESIFWSHVQPDVIVSGKVKRITAFGAFVSVDGFDCLAHIVDLSWTHIKSVDEVLKIGETYDFLVLNVDKEKGRVSLSYKLLQPHPFEKCLEQHPIGSICKGKVTSIVPFGAFVEIEKGIEGLVHVSEASHSFIKSASEVVKIGDEIDVMVLNADPANKKITLSIKATIPQDETTIVQDSEATPVKENTKRVPKEKKKAEQETSEWSDESSANTPFADLLKDLNLKK